MKPVSHTNTHTHTHTQCNTDTPNKEPLTSKYNKTAESTALQDVITQNKEFVI